MTAVGKRGAIAALTAGLALAVSGCAGSGGADSKSDLPRPDASAAVLPVLRRNDMLWLERASFGLDGATVADYRRLGRERFLDLQLSGQNAALPVPIAAQINALEVTHTDPLNWLADVNAQYKAINAMSDGPEREQARKFLNDRGNRLAYEAIRRELLRAVYSRAQLKEQMVWFWLNHFSVYQHKGNLRWLVGDYAENAIRPHALGHFKDLVMATLEHPAMLQYLDNNQNSAGHINENYARELMELHTLGVGSGYTQQDVQQMALVLTGVGINTGAAPKLKPDLQGLYLRKGAFEFNPARHDFSRKTLFGRAVDGKGFREVEDAVARIVAQPACAHFISQQLAVYFVADNPPPALVERMAQTFQHTDGDIAAVLRTMFLAHEFDAALGEKFKDPMRFVVSSVRFAYDGRTISNTRPLLNWLNSLGEAPFGRQTPDGYPMTELSWASSGQMSRRFEIARSIGSGNAGLFDNEDAPPAPAAVMATTGTAPAIATAAASPVMTTASASPVMATSAASPATTSAAAPTATAPSPVVASGFPQLSNRLYFEAVEPFLLPKTREALNRASSQQEWNTFLLSSPDFSYE